jgi:fumarate hydratase class II
MGEIEVASERLWGASTERALRNFRISTEKMPEALIRALAQVKKAAASGMRPAPSRCSQGLGHHPGGG